MAASTAFAGDDSPILEPLHFETSDREVFIASSGELSCPCVSCDEMFNLPKEKDVMLKHFVIVHKLVIADVTLIADLNKYLVYWKKRFSESQITDFCSVIQTNSKVTDLAPSEFYFVLCDSLPEDKILRAKLQIERLEMILEVQQKERTDTSFSRICLFCRQHFEGNRADLFNHMAEFHHFNVGHPDNLVYSNEMLDLMEDKLHSLKCLYCEKTFKDALVLKEHMRKKRHKRLHEGNASYHRFYVINYLEIGKNWKEIMSEDDRECTRSETNSDETDDWVDWSDVKAVCLFCDASENDFESILQHLTSTHAFDLVAIIKELRLNYYHQVKLINFIRRQVRQTSCTFCLEKFSSRDVLMEHMTQTGHVTRVPVSAVWDRPEFYFPTYENDNLLHMLPIDDNNVAGDGQNDGITDNSNMVDSSDSFTTYVLPEDMKKVDEESLKQLMDLKTLSIVDDI